MILCDFDDLNKQDFHLSFFDAVVQGNIEIITEILQHPKLSKQFDIAYNNYYCIIASILNSQQVNDCHLDLLKLFTQSTLLKKHANPLLCSQEDIFSGPLGNAIVFTSIETVRFLGEFFNEKYPKLQELIGLAIFNNKKEAFLYLVEERKFSIKNPDIIAKALVKFPHVDNEIINYVANLVKLQVVKDNQTQSNSSEEDNTSTQNLKQKSLKQKFIKNSLKNNKIISNTILLNISNFKQTSHANYWGSKFKQNF